MIIKFEINDAGDEGHDEKLKAKRMLAADDAFMLIWNILQLAEKHADGDAPDKRVLEEIRQDIIESNLLDLWQ